MIQCLPQSNKGLKEDFLIFSGQWHDGLPCQVKEGDTFNCSDSLHLTVQILVFPLSSAYTKATRYRLY